MDKKLNTIGSLIRKYRHEAGLTQKELSITIGYPDSVFLGQIENGQSKAPLKMVGLILQTLNVAEDEILNTMIRDYIYEVKKIFSNERNQIPNYCYKRSRNIQRIDRNLFEETKKKSYSALEVKKLIKNIEASHVRKLRAILNENRILKRKIDSISSSKINLN